MEQNRELPTASVLPKLANQQHNYPSRGDERSRQLRRQRARVMAEGSLELALEGETPTQHISKVAHAAHVDMSSFYDQQCLEACACCNGRHHNAQGCRTDLGRPSCSRSADIWHDAGRGHKRPPGGFDLVVALRGAESTSSRRDDPESSAANITTATATSANASSDETRTTAAATATATTARASSSAARTANADATDGTNSSSRETICSSGDLVGDIHDPSVAAKIHSKIVSTTSAVTVTAGACDMNTTRPTQVGNLGLFLHPARAAVQSAGGHLENRSSSSLRSLAGEERRKVEVKTQSSSGVSEQPEFVVLGLVGQNADRMLLLPTAVKREVTIGRSPAHSVVLEWDRDGDSRAKKSLLLARTKKKPVLPNPLPALATALAWARQLGPGALQAEHLLPTLPFPALAPPVAPTPNNVGSSNTNTSTLCTPGHKNGNIITKSTTATTASNEKGSVRSGSRDAAEPSPVSRFLHPENRNESLSVGAAWMLGHLVFGQQAGAARVESLMGGRKAPISRVSVAGSEATALGLLSCPGIGWNLDPADVVQTLSEAGDGVFYTAAATSMSTGRSDEGKEGGSGAEAEAEAEEVGSAGREACAACDELVAVGLCTRSQDRGWLELVPEVELAFELILKVFVNNWSLDRISLAHTALGSRTTGPMTMGVLPRSIHSLTPEPISPTDLSKLSGGTSAGVVLQKNAESTKKGMVPHRQEPKQRLVGREQRLVGVGVGRLSEGVGVLCVKLRTWCIEVTRRFDSCEKDQYLLWKIIKRSENPSKGANAAEVWNGSMAGALALLGGGGGGTSVNTSSNNCNWMACLSRGERILEPACVRLKEAVEKVVKMITGIVIAMQQGRKYGSAIALLRLLLSQEQGLAGEENRSAPDLAWAAGWCTSRFRGWAWIRLSMNLEHLGDGDACLESLRSACEDGFVSGGERVEVVQRLAAKHEQYGNPDDTPPLSPFPEASEEQIVSTLRVAKRGNKRSSAGGRVILYEDSSGGTSSSVSIGGSGGQEAFLAQGAQDKDSITNGSNSNSNSNSTRGMSVEEVVLKEAREDDSGAWAGLHCETDLVMTLMMLLLWEEVFDPTVEAAGAHCMTNQPLDLYDVHFWKRRRGLPARWSDIAAATDEHLWMDVGQRFDRYKGVLCARCNLASFSKQQVREVSLAFGGRRLSSVLRVLSQDLSHLNYGFPDLVLWRPKLQRRRGAHPLGQSGQPASWRGKEFGLGWEGVGQGWEVKVVEVKSVTDQLSMVQRAWLSALRDAGVPATVCRVAHLAPPKRSRKKN